MGSYLKTLKREKHIESEMSELILKSSISVLEKFNTVRNDHSLAHANKTLLKVESQFIVSAILNLIKFISEIENSVGSNCTEAMS